MLEGTKGGDEDAEDTLETEGGASVVEAVAAAGGDDIGTVFADVSDAATTDAGGDATAAAVVVVNGGDDEIVAVVICGASTVAADTLGGNAADVAVLADIAEASASPFFPIAEVNEVTNSVLDGSASPLLISPA